MIPYPTSRAFALLVLLLLAAPLLAIDLTGRVTAVGDGDTMTLLVPDGASFKQVKVRLGEIDTPESRQPYGERAKQQLSDLAFGRQARASCRTPTAMAARSAGPMSPGSMSIALRSLARQRAGQRLPDGDKPIPATIRLDPPRGLSARISVPQPVFSSA